MGERFNATGINGRDCPVCYRTGSLSGERGGEAAELKCGGCHTRFRLDRAALFGQLERIPVPVATRLDGFASAEQLRERAHIFAGAGGNACECGARISYGTTCSRCAGALDRGEHGRVGY